MLAMLPALASFLAVLSQPEESDFEELFNRAMLLKQPEVLLDALTFEQEIAFFDRIFDAFASVSSEEEQGYWRKVYDFFSPDAINYMKYTKLKKFLVSSGGYEDSERSRRSNHCMVILPACSVAFLRRSHQAVLSMDKFFQALPVRTGTCSSLVFHNSYQFQWAAFWFNGPPTGLPLTEEQQEILSEGITVEAPDYDPDMTYGNEVQVHDDSDEHDAFVKLDSYGIGFVAFETVPSTTRFKHDSPKILAVLEWQRILP